MKLETLNLEYRFLLLFTTTKFFLKFNSLEERKRFERTNYLHAIVKN